MTKPIPSGIALTGTGLDAIILAIANDDGLNTALNPKNDAAKAEKIAEGTHAAADMNILLDAAIKATGVAADGTISSDDVVKINSYLRSDPDMLARFTGDYGSDANGVDTGYHQIMCNGGVTQFRGHNVFNKIGRAHV